MEGSFLPVLSGWMGGMGGLGMILRCFLGLGSNQRSRMWMSSGPRDRALPPPPHGRCMTGAFFGVFGAATKCAMCYVAWFIIFLQATKLICSPIV